MVKVKTFTSPLKVFQVKEELENLDRMVNRFIKENNVQRVASVSDTTSKLSPIRSLERALRPPAPSAITPASVTCTAEAATPPPTIPAPASASSGCSPTSSTPPFQRSAALPRDGCGYIPQQSLKYSNAASTVSNINQSCQTVSRPFLRVS